MIDFVESTAAKIGKEENTRNWFKEAEALKSLEDCFKTSKGALLPTPQLKQILDAQN